MMRFYILLLKHFMSLLLSLFLSFMPREGARWIKIIYLRQTPSQSRFQNRLENHFPAKTLLFKSFFVLSKEEISLRNFLCSLGGRSSHPKSSLFFVLTLKGQPKLGSELDPNPTYKSRLIFFYLLVSSAHSSEERPSRLKRSSRKLHRLSAQNQRASLALFIWLPSLV